MRKYDTIQLLMPALKPHSPEEMYLDLLKNCLTRTLFFGHDARVSQRPGLPAGRWFIRIQKVLNRLPAPLLRHLPVHPAMRDEGRDWPADAETMIGRRRLDHLQQCVMEVLRRDVPGDLIEAGVWRGGAAILMRAVLRACGGGDRIVWVADSFQGLPQPNPKRYPADAGGFPWGQKRMAVPLETVRGNFERYGLLDDRVRFLPGWFRDTLPSAPIERLAILRVDGDLYESTMDALRSLYGKVSAGGYIIVDDYGAMPSCRAAVEDFRTEKGIREPLQWIDWTGVFWQKDR